MLYEIPLLQYVDPETLDEAVSLLTKLGEKAKIIAGGTDLLGLLKDGISGSKMPYPEVLVSIKRIPTLRSMDFDSSNGLRIGAGVTLSEIEESSKVLENYNILAQAASSVATRQIRNVGTIGGNLSQRPWCWYFRNSLFPCFKKGGKQCYAITGEHEYYYSIMGLGTCVMSHPSDLAPALMVLDATISIIGPNGARKVPINRFFNGPKEVFENILNPNEIIVQIEIPASGISKRGAYVKDRVRGTWDLALSSAAVLLDMDGEKCKAAKVCLGGMAPYPFVLREAEAALVDQKVTEEVAKNAAVKGFEKAKGLPMTKYKIELGRVILKRAIMQAAQNY